MTELTFPQTLDNYLSSEQFANVPKEEKGIAIDAFRDSFIKQNQISDEKAISFINDSSKNQYDRYRDIFNIPRFMPNQEMSAELYGSPIIDPKASTEDKIKSVELWRDEAKKKASTQFPTMSEDMGFDVEDKANNLIRNIAGEDKYKSAWFPWISDNVARGVESFIDPVKLADYNSFERFKAKNLVENPQWDENISSDFASGIGQLLSQTLVASALTAAGAPEAVAPTFGLLYGAQYMQDAYHQEMKRTGNKFMAEEAAVNSLPAAFLDTFSDAFLFHGLGKTTDFAKSFTKAATEAEKRALIKKAIPSIGKEVTEQFLSEGLIGGAGADIASNLGNYYATGDEKYLDNAKNINKLARSAFVEGVLGGVFGGVHAGIAKDGAQKNVSQLLSELTLNKAKSEDIFQALKAKDYNKVIDIIGDKTISPESLDKLRDVSNPDSKIPLKDRAKTFLDSIPEERRSEIENRPYVKHIDDTLRSLQTDPEKNKAAIEQLQQARLNFYDEQGVPKKFEQKMEFDSAIDLFQPESEPSKQTKKSFDVTLEDETNLKNDNVVYVDVDHNNFIRNLNLVNLHQSGITLQTSPNGRKVKLKGQSRVYEASQNPAEGLTPIIISNGKIQVLAPVKSFTEKETDQQRADKNQPPSPDELKQNQQAKEQQRIQSKIDNKTTINQDESDWHNSVGEIEGLVNNDPNALIMEKGYAYRRVTQPEVDSLKKEGRLIPNPENQGKKKRSQAQVNQKMWSKNTSNKRFGYSPNSIVLRIPLEKLSLENGVMAKESDIDILRFKDGKWNIDNKTTEQLTETEKVIDQPRVDKVAEKISKKTGKKVEAPVVEKPKKRKVKKKEVELLPENIEEVPQDVKEEILASEMDSQELSDTLGITKEVVDKIRNENQVKNPSNTTKAPKTIDERVNATDDQWKLSSLEASIQYHRDIIQNSPDQTEKESSQKKLDLLLPQLKELKDKNITISDKTNYFDLLEKQLRKGQLKSDFIQQYIQRGFLTEDDLKSFAQSKGFEYNGSHEDFIRDWKKSNLGKKVESNPEKELDKQREQRRIDQKNRLTILAHEVNISDNITIVNDKSELPKDLGVEVSNEDQAFVINNQHVYFVLDNIDPYDGESPVQAVERIFKHEVVGHMKMSKVLDGISPEGYNNLKEFLKTLKYKNGINVWEDRQKVYPDAQEDEIVDEIFAKLAEQRTKQDRNIIQKIINWIRINLLKSGQESNWTQQDLEIMLQEAFHIDLNPNDNKSIRKSKSYKAVHLNSSLKGMYGAWITPNGQIDEVQHQDHFGYALEKIGEENAKSVDQVYNELYNRGYLRAVNLPSGVFVEGHKLSSAQKAVLDFVGINDEKNIQFNNKTIYSKPEVRFSKSSIQLESRGADIGRAIKMLGSSFYEAPYQTTMMKELAQNGIDAARQVKDGFVSQYSLTHDNQNGTFTSYSFTKDNGIGMSPEDVINKYLPAFVTGKVSNEAGGFGFAKLLFLGDTDKWRIVTIKDGKKTTINGTSDGWIKYVSQGNKSITIEYNKHIDIGGIDFIIEDTSDKNGTTYLGEKTSEENRKFNSRSYSTKFPKFLSGLNDPKYVTRAPWTSSSFDYPYGPNFDSVFNEASRIHDNDEYIRSKDFDDTIKMSTISDGASFSSEGFDMKILLNEENKIGRNNSINIFVNGIGQFDVDVDRIIKEMDDIKLPRFYINFEPKVRPENPLYPFNKSRDGLNKEASNLINSFASNLIKKAKEIELGELKDAIKRKNITTNNGNNVSIYGAALGLSKEEFDDISNDETTHLFGDIFIGLNNLINDKIVKRFGNFTFDGISVHPNSYGFRFGNTDKKSKGSIYFNPILLLNGSDGAINTSQALNQSLTDSLSDLLRGVLMHEVAHQISHSEGEGHARAMTFVGIEIDNVFGKYITDEINKIGDEKLKTFASKYSSLLERIREAYDSEKEKKITEALKTNESEPTLQILGHNDESWKSQSGNTQSIEGIESFKGRNDESPTIRESNNSTQNENDGINQSDVRFSRVSAGENFAYTLVPYDAETNKLGKHKLPNTGLIDLSAFKKMGVETGELKDEEIQLYKQLVPEAFKDNKVDIPNLVEGLKEKGPQIEVKKLGESQLPQVVRDFNKMKHEWHDNLLKEIKDDIFLYEDKNENVSNDAKKRLEENNINIDDVDRFIQLKNETANIIDKKDKSQYAFVAPKAESDMPGYVEGLVRVPRVQKGDPRYKQLKAQLDKGEGLTYPEESEEWQNLHKAKYTGPHFGSHDTNVISFFRGYEETLPDGKKAFHVIEVQTDVLIDHHDGTFSVRDHPEMGRFGGIGISKSEAKKLAFAKAAELHATFNDGVWQSLALKAAINHAREIGAEKLILSDAETAMMSEGHDINIDQNLYAMDAEFVPDEHGIVRLKFKEDPQQRLWKTATEANKVAKEEGWRKILKQEKGMRLHYDITLPSELRRLTGDKGTKVELGVHDKALGKVFRNSDGTPKSSITGTMYDISHIEPNKPVSLFNTRFSKKDNKNTTQQHEELDYLLNDDSLQDRAKSQTSREYAKLLKQKLEQKLIIKEKNIWNAFRDIQFNHLDQSTLENLLADLKNFVETRTHQEEPSTERTSVDDLQDRLTDYKNKANEGEYNYWKGKLESLPDFKDYFKEDIEAVRAYVKEEMDNGEDSGIKWNDSDFNYIDAIMEMQFDVLDRADDEGDIVNRLFSESNDLLQPTGNEHLDGISELIQDKMKSNKALYGEYILHLATLDPSSLSRSERRQVYYSLLSISTDGYPNRVNSFISTDIMNLIKNQDYVFRNPYGTRKGQLISKLESNPSQIARLASNVTGYNALIQLQAPLREGLALAKRVYEQYLTPYVESQVNKYYNGVLDKDHANLIGLYIHLRQRFMTETKEQGLKSAIEWIKSSNKNLNIYDKDYQTQGQRQDFWFEQLLNGINYEMENGKIKGDLTPDDVAMFHSNAQKLIGQTGIDFSDSLVKLFETMKPLAKFTQEFVYGRTFDEVENFIPSMSVIVKGDGSIEPDMSQFQLLTDNKSIREGKVGYSGINTTGSSTTKERSRSVGNNRTLILNPMYLADSVGRLAVYDYFTAHQRQEMSRLLRDNSKAGKQLAKFLGDSDQSKGRMQAFRNAMNNMWQNEMSQASYLHPWHQLTNWLARKRAQSVLSGAYQLPAQTLSNTIPYFVQHINEPRKIGNYVKGLLFYAKYKVGALTEPQTKLFDQILFEVNHRQQDVTLDKSINLGIDPNNIGEWFKRNLPMFYKSIQTTDKIIEKTLMIPFKLSDMVSGSPMMLAEYLNREEDRTGRSLRFEDLSYNRESYIAALDDVERYIGIGDNSRRGEFFTNRNASISMARNLLVAFRSFSINNANNFMMEAHKVIDGAVDRETKINSLKYMGGILSQSILFNGVKISIQLMLAKAMIGALKNPDDDEELKKLYRKQQGSMSENQRKMLNAEIAMREQLRKALGKLEERNLNKRIISINTAKDAASNMFVFLNLDFVPNSIIHILDEAGTQEFQKQKKADVDRLQKAIKRNKNLGNLKTVAALQEELRATEMQEFIPVVFKNQGLSGIGGSFGGAVEGIITAMDSSAKAFYDPKAISAEDFVNVMAAMGVSQPDVMKYMKALDKKNNIIEQRNEKEARLQQNHR